jgi:hypothetical protein
MKSVVTTLVALGMLAGTAAFADATAPAAPAPQTAPAKSATAKTTKAPGKIAKSKKHGVKPSIVK